MVRYVVDPPRDLHHVMGRQQGKVVRNVASLTDGPRQQEEKDGRSLTIEQAKQLLKTIKGERLEALYVLMLSTGIRPGEAFALPWKNWISIKAW